MSEVTWNPVPTGDYARHSATCRGRAAKRFAFDDETFDLVIAQALKAERDPLVERWNESVAGMLEVVESLARYAGRLETHHNLPAADGRLLRRDTGPLPQPIPFELVEQFLQAVRAAWNHGLDEGEQIAVSERVQSSRELTTAGEP